VRCALKSTTLAFAIPVSPAISPAFCTENKTSVQKAGLMAGLTGMANASVVDFNAHLTSLGGSDLELNNLADSKICRQSLAR
jgi:hypothetical protein